MSKVAKGILWIFSGPILLIVAVIFQIFIKIAFNGEGIIATLFNIATWLTGVVAVLLFIIGPIIGIIVLAKKPNNTSK
jgi:hypothetical protein